MVRESFGSGVERSGILVLTSFRACVCRSLAWKLLVIVKPWKSTGIVSEACVVRERPLVTRESRPSPATTCWVGCGMLNWVLFVSVKEGEIVIPVARESGLGEIARDGSVIVPLPSLSVTRRVPPRVADPHLKRRV